MKLQITCSRCGVVEFLDPTSIAVQASDWRLNVAPLCPACVSVDDPDVAARLARIQGLCRALSDLGPLRDEQQHQLDEIFDQLEVLVTEARLHPRDTPV
jgi:hypothetical protein